MCVYQINVRLPSNMSIWFLHSSVVPVKNLISNCFSGWITYAGVKTSFREQFSSLGHPDMICTHGVFVLFLIVMTKYPTGSNYREEGFALLMVLWDVNHHGGGFMVADSSMWEEVCSLDSSYHGGQEADNKQGLGPGYKTSWPSYNKPSLPVRHCFLKVSQLC